MYLIRKENIDVLDIPMARLTAQYLEYVEMMRTRSLELAAEYLLMAAMLIEIKSRMLLPRPPRADVEEDPRAELVRRLLEYERMKQAARRLNELPQCRPRFRAGAGALRADGARPAAGGQRRRPAERLAHAARARGRKPASPHHAQAAFGARAHEQGVAQAPGSPLRRVLRAVRSRAGRRRCSSSRCSRCSSWRAKA